MGVPDVLRCQGQLLDRHQAPWRGGYRRHSIARWRQSLRRDRPAIQVPQIGHHKFKKLQHTRQPKLLELEGVGQWVSEVRGWIEKACVKVPGLQWAPLFVSALSSPNFQRREKHTHDDRTDVFAEAGPLLQRRHDCLRKRLSRGNADCAVWIGWGVLYIRRQWNGARPTSPRLSYKSPQLFDGDPDGREHQMQAKLPVIHKMQRVIRKLAAELSPRHEGGLHHKIEIDPQRPDLSTRLQHLQASSSVGTK